MSYLHPEKVFGVGLKPVERVINYLAQIPVKGDTEDSIDQVMKKLSKNDKRALQMVLEHDRDDKGSLNLITSHAMKAVIDIKTDRKIPVYSIGKEFFRHVKKLDRDIPIRHVDLSNKHVYFTFDNPDYEGAYVTSEVWETHDGKGEDTGFMALRIALTPKVYGISSMKVFNFAIVGDSFNFADLYHSKTGEEMKDYAKTFSETNKSVVVYAGSYDKYRDLLIGIMNSLIYINSKDPQIESLKPSRLYNKKELAAVDSDKKSQIRTVPVNLVSWSMYGKRYNVDETVVSTHMRWQPCGPNRSEIKLVWVKEHTRTYNS